MHKAAIPIFLTLLLLTVFGTCVRAQTDSLHQLFLAETDPLVRSEFALDLTLLHYRANRPDSANYFARTVLETGKRLASDSLRGRAYGWLMTVAGSRGDEVFRLYADSSLYFLSLAEKQGERAKVHGNFAYSLSKVGDCDGAVRNMALSDSLYQGVDRTARERLRGRMRYTGLLRECGMYELVPPLAKEILPLAIREGIPNDRTVIYDHLMTTYGEVGELDSALVYLEKLEALLPAVNRESTYLSFYTNAARVYFQRKEFDKAYGLSKLGLDIKLSKPLAARNGAKTAVAHYNVAQAAFGLGKFAESRDNFIEALTYFQEIDYADNVQEICLQLAEAYGGLGDYKSAYDYWKRGDVLRDSLEAVRYKETIGDLTIKHETERVGKELVQAELQAARAEKKNRMMVLFFGIFLLAAALLFYVISNRRRRKQLEYEKRQAELRYNLLRAQMNPHFIFNSLNSIQSFFSNQRFNQGNEFLGTFSLLVRRVLEQTGQPAITLSEELETLTLYLELEKVRLGSNLSFEISLSDSVESDLMKVPPLILQPFVENSIWHGIAPKGGAGRIDVTIDYDDEIDALYCIIEDDGVGMRDGPGTDDGSHRSRGVEITRERLGRGGRVDVTNRSPGDVSGVRTEIIIPLKN